MKTLNKPLSVILAVMMVLGMIMSMPFTAGAAETNTITVTSNICDPVVYDYDSNDKQVTVTYYLECTNKIINSQATLKYDSTVLSLADTNTPDGCMPVFSNGSSMINFDLADCVKFNATSLNLYNFTNKGVFFTITFDIIGSGETTVNLDVQVITATTATNFTEVDAANDIDLVFYNTVLADAFTFSADAVFVSDEEPTTEPTTTEPVTEPTTEPTTQPTTQPDVTDDITLKFIVPKTVTSPKCWDNGVYLAYSNDYTLDSFTKLELSKTTDYLTPDLNTDNLTAGTYNMYSITLTEEQAEAINSATYVAVMNHLNDYRTYISGKGNILRAPVGAYSDTYNTEKTSVAALDGYTFIMNDEIDLGTSIQGFGTYTGYWTKCTNLQVVVPSASIWNNCWNQGVYLGYSNDYTLDSFTKIKMTRTSTYVDVESGTSQLVSGTYPVYTVSLTEEDVAAIDSSTYVIFCNRDSDYRTYINGKYSVMKALTDTHSDTYSTEKATVAQRANNTFVLCGGLETGTSIEGYGTFTGYWLTEELEIVESTATLYCVFPSPAKYQKAMDNGVYLAYGNSGAASDLTYIEMDKTDEIYTPDLKTDALVAGDYPVYKITLTSDQIEAINSSRNVVFCSSDGDYRTLLAQAYNVLLAKSGTYSATYNTAKFVVEDHNGETFVVCDTKVTGSSTDGYGMFLGYWDLGEEK